MALTESQKRRNKQKRIILTRLRNGATLQMASDLAGITRQTLDRWRKDDPEYDALCKKARAGFGYEHLVRLGKASRAGDIKSARMLVERHPSTREDYGRQDHAGSGLVLNFNIPRDPKLVKANRPVIEHKAESTD